MFDLKSVLTAARERAITKDEALFLFYEVDTWDKYLQLFSVASAVRDELKSRKFKLEAFILTSNQGCSTSPPCRYCGQASTKKESRFFFRPATLDEVRTSARIAEKLGFKTVQCGGGCSGNKGAEAVADAEAVINCTNLKVFVNYGADMSEENIIRLKELGVDRVGCSFEVINRELFREIKPGCSFEALEEVAANITKHEVPLHSVVMVGIGESYEDRVEHLFFLKSYPTLKAISISGFFPIPGTPMANRLPATSLDIAKSQAIARLILRDIDIGGSFGRDDQLQLWIMAGTNLRTIHGMFEPKNKITPGRRFSGKVEHIGEDFVFINVLPIYLQMIEQLSLEPDLVRVGRIP